MKHRLRIAIPLLVLVALASGGYWWYRTGAVWPGAQTAAAESAQISGSGTIEAEEVLITAEIGGRVKALPVEEGDEVTKGAVLTELDTALLQAQLEQARAGVQTAEANLALLKAGARSEEITQAEAQVAQAQAARDGAASALQNAESEALVKQAETQANSARRSLQAAQAVAANPQDVQVQIDAAQANLDAAQRRLETLQAGSRAEDIEQARVAVTAAQNNYWAANLEYEEVSGNDKASERVKEAARLKLESARLAITSATAVYDKLIAGPSQEDLNAAQTAVDSATRTLQTLQALKSDPKALKLQVSNAQAQYQNAAAAIDSTKAARQTQVDAASAQLGSAEAALKRAQAQLEEIQAGARSEQIQAAEAQVAQAKASALQLEVQLGKARLTAPRDGVILSRPIHEGEQATPGATLMTLGDLTTVKLMVFVPENQVGRVRLGQEVQVSVDTFPDRAFVGKVTYITPQAEFTPRNVQTKEERVTTVFGVRVELPNSDHALKPGMPADATFVEAQ